MKLKEVMFAWNPGGEIKVGEWPDRTGWTRPYLMTSGACYVDVQKFNGQRAALFVFVEAMHIIVRDNVDPKSVHREFMKIDEYRDGCAIDMPKIKGMA